MGVQLGIVGKPNTGKSTFFAAATLLNVKIAPYPFTTIDPNVGVGYVRFRCVCRELGVKDEPRNSLCVDGWRFAPVELIDVAGLVPDAWQGRGLGNKFLDELRRAHALIHVIDASGGTDEEGRPVKPGTHDPLEDVRFLEKELDMWIYQIMKRDWDRVSKAIEYTRAKPEQVLYERLCGLGVKRDHVLKALEELGLYAKRPSAWSDSDLLSFIKFVRKLSKPMVIAANKADVPAAHDNIKRLLRELKGEYIVVPTSAEAELALRRAAKAGLIKYLPGDNDFEIIGKLTRAQQRALEYIRENVLKPWGSTGVQEVLNRAVFDLLKFIAVFPVANEHKFSDSEGHVLPDVYLLPPGATAKDLAYEIHSEIGEKFAFAIDARTGKRLSGDTKLKHRDVIKIVVAR